MKKTIITIIVLIIWSIGCFLGGRFHTIEFWEKPKPEIVYKEKIKYNVIYKDYEKMPEQEKNARLFHYDQDPFKLDINKISEQDNMFRLTGELYERKAQRDIKIKCSENSHFKVYFTVAVVAAGTYAVYKLVKK